MIHFTDKAQQRLRDAAASITPKIVRLGVVGGGCSGFQYSLGFAEKVEELDKVYLFEGFQVVVDPVSMMYLDGVTVGFAEANMSAGFTFDNPKAKRTCGCGSSFEA